MSAKLHVLSLQQMQSRIGRINQFFYTKRCYNTLQLLEDINHKDNIQQKDVGLNDISKNILNIFTQAADSYGLYF